ncbi:MAG: Gfo/Idh/MocA family oxidoreductase [Anaerolineaceae bacterium]|nr:Gfo/Idh/MocA family oxidoreductase [Anaerolineaceae bacterium]
MDTLKLGIVSFAHGHVRVYADVMRDFEDAQIVAAWDDDEARGRQYCQEFGIDFVPNLDSLLARRDLDAVFIASPTNRHADHCLAAARARKHILLQKPMALSLEDCDAIIEAVAGAGVKFSLCYQMRADPVNRHMKALLDEGAIGQVAVLRRRHAIPLLLSPDFARPDNWHIDPVQNMGMFMDDASHAADFLYWMLGAPVSVMAEIDNLVTDVAPDDNGVAIYRFAGGEIGILFNSSTTLAAENTTEIYGDAGSIIQNHGDVPSANLPRLPGAMALKIWRQATGAWELPEFPLRPHGERIRDVARPLVDYLHGRCGPLATAEDGRVCIEMILGAYESARTGRRVFFNLAQEICCK